MAEAITHYQARWRDVFRPADGKPPVLNKADRGQLVAMLKAHGGEGWRALLERYLADRDPYLLANGHALAHMPRRVNGYRARPNAAKVQPKELGGDLYARQFAKPRPPGEEDR